MSLNFKKHSFVLMCIKVFIKKLTKVLRWLYYDLLTYLKTITLRPKGILSV